MCARPRCERGGYATNRRWYRELEDGPIQPDVASYANETDMNQVGIEIHLALNRILCVVLKP